MTQILAGDAGGTNTRLAIYDPGGRSPRFTRVYPSSSQSSLEQLAQQFLDDVERESGTRPAVDRGCIGVAGPVDDNVCRATNLPWVVDGRRLGRRLGIDKLELVNDFVAMARSVLELGPDDVRTFGGGPAQARKPIAVLGPGTGLGHAFLIWSDAANGYRVVQSEGGHADFAPRTPMEGALMQYLTLRYGRVSNERVLCGHGLVDIVSFLDSETAWQRLLTPEVRADLAADDAPARISRAAVDGSDPVCRVALSMFAGTLGAVAGNLALLVLATGGVYIGGGIAPRMVDFLDDSGMRDAFEEKGRFRTLLKEIPLSVITHDSPGLLGAAARATEL